MNDMATLFLTFKSKEKVEENVRLRYLQRFGLTPQTQKYKSTVQESLEEP